MSGIAIFFGIVAVLTWMLAGRLWLTIWRNPEGVIFKNCMSVIVLIPYVGPFLYFFFRMPPPAPADLQQGRMNHNGRSQPLGNDYATLPSSGLSSGGRRQTASFVRTALILGTLLLMLLWPRAILLVLNDDPWGYRNAVGQRVGTISLLAVLVAGSVACSIGVWRVLIQPRLKRKKSSVVA
jgi:hypothetical protein